MEKEYIAKVTLDSIDFCVYAESLEAAKKSATETAENMRRIISEAVCDSVYIESVEVERGG